MKKAIIMFAWMAGIWGACMAGTWLLGYLGELSGLASFVIFVVGVVGLTAYAVMVRIRTARIRRRTRDYLRRKCLKCGYDLRAGHERCPECGDELMEQAAQKQSQNPKAP